LPGQEELWGAGLLAKLYVVSHRPDADPLHLVWTVSPRPDGPGWETDGGFWGYGLPRSVAEEICRRWNSTIGVAWMNYVERAGKRGAA
jgi:hypothetical protein